MSRNAMPVDDDETLPRWTSALTNAAFIVLIVSVLARATMLETLRDAFDVTVGAQSAIPRGLGAAGSFVLDWIACIPALFILARRAIERRSFQLRSSMAFAFLVPLAVFAAASSVWSADRFVAVLGASHFVAAVAICWASFQLVRDGLHRRIIFGACFGLLLVLIAHSLVYRFVELPDTQHSVEQDWPQILEARGWAPDSFLARQFHQKVMAGELFGFTASPNSLAAMLVFLGIISAGAMWQRFSDRDQPGWPILIALAFPLALPVLWYTHSKTAFATPFLALIAFTLIAIFPATLQRHRKAVFFTGIALTLLGILAVVGHGLAHDGLPTDSLNFRWKYWTGAVHVFVQHKWLGVGWNNFGDYYVAVRRPEAAEEIKDPHDLFVRIATELGLVGLALFVGWLVTLAWSITRADADEKPMEAFRNSGSPHAAIKRVLVLAVGAMALNSVFSIDFTQDLGWVFIEVMKRVLFAALLCAGIIIVAFRSVEHADFDDRPGNKLRIAGAIGLFIFLIHNAIDFSFFESGPMWTFMLVAGAVMSNRKSDESEFPESAPSRLIAIFGISSLGIAWLLAGMLIGFPLLLAESKANDADDAMRTRNYPKASALLIDAYNTLSFSNADYLTRAAAAQITGGMPADLIRETLNRAIAADPQSSSYPRRLAEFELRVSPPDLKLLRDAFSKAIALNPNDVEVRLEFARALESEGDRTAAAQEYLAAIEKNDLLDAAEPKRLPIDERNRIESHARALSN